MRTKMEYHIISGKVIETRRCYLSDRNGQRVRGTRKAGASSMRKIAANERETVKRLGRILNTNFGNGFLFVTLKYSNQRLPADYEAARETAEKFLRKARSLHEKQNGEKLHYLMVTANWSPQHNRAARLHHHIVMDQASIDMLEKLWPHGEFHVKRVNYPNDLTQLAEYLLKNVHDIGSGKKKWSACKGLDKPVFTEPKPVDDIESIPTLPNTSVVDGYQVCDETGAVAGSYVRCICHERIKVRGGQVVLPRASRRKRSYEDINTFVCDDE